MGTLEAYGPHVNNRVDSRVVWHDSSTDADDALRAHVSAVLGIAPSAVSTGRLCPECGSDRHGQPWATGGVHVSLSRSGPHLMTAVSIAGPIGVDVEATDEIGRGEPVDWVRKEAILKLIGRGLAVPMSEVEVSEYDVRAVDAPEGYAAAVATYLSEHG